MAKSKTRNSTKALISKGRAEAKAAEATKPKKSPQTEKAPPSTDIRRVYLKSLLGDYLGTHRDAPAIKPKKK
jgi:hypothetical protein